MTVAAAPRLTGGAIASVVLHGGVVAAAFFLVRPGMQAPQPPIYRVQLIAAPAGERAVGVVQEAPQTPPVETPPPPATKAPVVRPKVPATKAKPTPPPKIATPAGPPKPATEAKPVTPEPTAGGGPTGGKGADVANIDTNGLDFPYPWYTAGITREILRRFHPANGSFVAEVRFVIQRDGTVDPNSINLVTPSASYPFNQQARGAVEAAANAKAFGPLPPGFHEDILPVTFRFSPSLIQK